MRPILQGLIECESLTGNWEHIVRPTLGCDLSYKACSDSWMDGGLNESERRAVWSV